MGKVQEFIDQIGTNTRAFVELSEQLQVPALQGRATVASKEAPTDPDGIESWLVTHNAFKAGDKDKNLLQHLSRCNRSQITPKNRIEILQHFEKPVTRILQSKDREYLHKTLPLSPDAESGFELATGLCREMAYGYKIVLHDDAKIRTTIGRKSRAEVIRQALEHLGRVAIRHSLVYRPWPLDFWQDTNLLARMALQGHSKNLKNDTGHAVDKYAQLAAFSILAKNSFTTAELQGLFQTLSGLASTIPFHKKPTGNGYEHYCTGGKNPPSLCLFSQYRKKDSPLYFSIKPLVDKFNELQRQNENAPGQFINLQAPLNRNNRTTLRAPRNTSINAITGLKDIGQHIRALPQTSTAESRFTNLHTLASNSCSQTDANAVLHQGNVPVVGAAFSIENQSRDGFHLCRKNDGSDDTGGCKLRVGELIAHCYGEHPSNINWYVGEIRWLNTKLRDNTINLGVKTISEHTSVVEIFRFPNGKERSDASFKALYANYLPDDNKTPLLLVPPHTFLTGEIIGFRDQDGFRLAKLAESGTHTSQFQSFAIVTLQHNAEPLNVDKSPQPARVSEKGTGVLEPQI